MFIAFDGIDGAGKTSTYMALAEELSKNSIVDLYDMGELGFLNDVITGIKRGNLQCDAEIREYIYYFEGVLFSERIAKKYVGDPNHHVLIDRYILSYLSYGPSNGVDVSRISDICSEMIWPDFYFFIDTPPCVALQRILNRGHFSRAEVGYKNNLSKNENENKQLFLAHQTKVYDNFQRAIKLSKNCIHVVDNSKDDSHPLMRIVETINKHQHG